jgi:hypothetical protein
MSLPNDTKGEAAGGYNYTSWNDGLNKILIVDPRVVTGYQYWTKNDGPKRQREVFDTPLPDDAQTQKNPKTDEEEQKRQQFFWTLVIYNFESKKFEICQVTQKGIRDDLLALQENEDWGDPVGQYTIAVNRKNENGNVGYSANGNPVKEATKKEIAEIMEAYKGQEIDPERAMFGEG